MPNQLNWNFNIFVFIFSEILSVFILFFIFYYQTGGNQMRPWNINNLIHFLKYNLKSTHHCLIRYTAILFIYSSKICGILWFRVIT